MIRIRKNSIAFAALLALCGSLTATKAFAAPGDCLQWDVSGSWHITQSNGTNVLMKIQQTGTHIQGVAEYSSYNNDAGKVQTVGGPVDGTFESNRILRVTVYWSNSTAGLYVGQVEPDGGMTGYSHEQDDPGNKADFRASGYPNCLSREAAPPPPAPAPAKPPVARSAVEAVSDHSALYAAAAASKPAPMAPPAAPAQSPPPAPAPPPVPASTLDKLAAIGAAIAAQDPAVAEARNTRPNAAYLRGFDIASGLFGDPALGSAGNTVMGPGSESIRATLSAAGQRGFNASVAFHLARDYKH